MAERKKTAAAYPNMDCVSAIDISVDLAGIVPILKGFCCWAVILLVSFLSVFRALRHLHNSLARWSVHCSI